MLHAFWIKSSSPKDSTDRFLKKWEAFIRNQKTSGTNGRIKVGGVVDLNDTIALIESKPRFNLVAPDIQYLRAWFDGAQFASRYFSVRIQPDIEAFARWLRTGPEFRESCPWDMLLTAHSGGDPEWAFQKFFERLRLFHEAKRRPLKRGAKM
jgi:hypothetical protein